jgi:D-arginine dehydrogenase
MLAADFLIVGGGIAGISAAAAMSELGTVVLIEKESALATHSTGRSVSAFLGSYGGREVQILTKLSAPLIKEAEEASGVQMMRPRPLLWISNIDQHGALDDLLAEARSLDRIDAHEARNLCSALDEEYVFAAAIDREAADLDAMALHAYYHRLALRRGVHIHLSTKLIAGTSSGHGWNLETSRGPARCGIVVNAAGAWADQVGASLGGSEIKLFPKKRTVAVAATTEVDRDWPLTIDVNESFYFRPEDSGVLISPADETDQPAGNPKVEPEDVALALERVNAATTLHLTSVEHSWAGLRTFSQDRLPIVGFDGVSERLFWLAGQGGFGIQTAPSLAAICVSLIESPDLSSGEIVGGLPFNAMSPARF